MEKTLETRQCHNCEKDFPVMEKDQEFYEMMDVPRPTFCYICRMQRRLNYRNERFLYHRKCDLTGKDTISSFSIDKPFPVYDNDAWWSDDWDPLTFGRNFDFEKPFFEQFLDLRDTVPRIARQQQKPMWNSDYCNCASQNRNCYLVFSTNRCEDCYYGSWVNDCKNCIDGKNISGCELCYDCVGCTDCYDLKYSQDCRNCKNSYFLRDCLGCMYCFACSNLQDKEYYIFNERKTKKEYEDFMRKINLGSYQVVQDGKEKAQKILQDLIVKEYHGTNIENSIGDYLHDCKNAYMAFECDHCEDVRYCVCLEQAKSSMDHSHWGVGTERMYECQACGYDNFNLRFCNLCWSGCSDLTYCDQCFSSKDCLGCISMKKNQYCILNKQYSKSDYTKLRDQIIKHMKKTGEWGEFFPANRAIYGYNESLAQEQVKMSKKEVIARNWLWKDSDPRDYLPQSVHIPDDICEIDSQILETTLSCQNCGKNYKIIPPELKFYKKQTIPIPRKCHDCRHYDRMELKNLRIMYDRKCQRCHENIRTTYHSKDPAKVFCEKCYLEVVY